MAVAWRLFPTIGVSAIFEEDGLDGDPLDPAAPRNAPAVNPAGNLDKVRFSTELDLLEVVSETTVAINHSAVSSATSDSVSNTATNTGTTSHSLGTLRFNFTSAEFDLVTHSLGYVPDFMVVVGDDVLMPGKPVQVDTGGRGRYCSAYATTSKIILREFTSVNNSGLPAATINYRILIFREPRDASGDDLFKFNPATGITKMGFDRFSSDRRYLQVVSGGSPFGISYGKTMDAKNGAMRFVDPDGSIFDPVPSTATRFIISFPSGSGLDTYDGTPGSPIIYNGSFDGSEEILVQAP